MKEFININKWVSFLEKKKAIREKHLDKLFIKDYNDVYKIFHKMIKQEG